MHRLTAATTIAAATLAATAAANAQTLYTVQVLPQYGFIELSPAPPGAPPRYTVVGSIPNAINESGVVSGDTGPTSADGAKGWRFNTKNAQQLVLEDDIPGFLGSSIADTNANNISIGEGFNTDNDFTTAGLGFTVQNGTVTELPALLNDPFVAASPQAINSHNTIVGSSPSVVPGFFDEGEPRAVKWNGPGSQPETLAFPGGTQSKATDINENGTIIGVADTADDPFLKSVVWNADGSFTFAPTIDFDGGDPSLPGFAQTSLADINDNDIKVGKADRAFGQRYPVIVDENNNATLLPTFDDPASPDYTGDDAFAINNHGTIVGRGNMNDELFPLLWTDADATPINLDTLYGSDTLRLVEAVDINDQGQILVLGFETVTFDGTELQQAVSVVLNPIPTPATAATLALAGAAATTRRRRHA